MIGKRSATISDWERGKHNPSLDDVRALAAALGVEPDKLAFATAPLPPRATPYMVAKNTGDVIASKRAAAETYLARYLDEAQEIPGMVEHALGQLMMHLPISALHQVREEAAKYGSPE